MHGALLHSGSPEAFDALGEAGRPLYLAARQILEAIRRRDSGLAMHLAVPHSTPSGDRID